ncbi:MAG: hypothetical protein EBR82_72310 [Caulobacteraceae bacterium]|nr:hypothetical protein [Caulobacteraceae bacterium]
MGGPSIPEPPPPPDPRKAALANELFYRSSVSTYLEKQGEFAAEEARLREKYYPRQRELEREFAAQDAEAQARSALETERKYGAQRSLENLRRQYELNPQAFALNRAMGQQISRDFARTYGANPMESVPGAVRSGRDEFLGAV